MKIRLIDADALSNELAKMWRIPDGYGGAIREECEDAFAAIDDAPTIDAVPVVRCRECKWWGDDEHLSTNKVKYCQFGRYMVGDNGYCVYGEMSKEKTDETD